MNIAEEAQNLVLGDRNQSYGSPAEEFARVAKVWSGLLGPKLKADLDPADIPILMTALKLCRETHRPKRDNRVDIIGYALCLDWTATGVSPGASPAAGS